VTDVGTSALGAGCGQLQSIDLTACSKVTDAGASAWGAGCGQLQSIRLTGCGRVTDAGVSASGAGCGKRQIICFKSFADGGYSCFDHNCDFEVHQQRLEVL
jgi:hypothetical protein